MLAASVAAATAPAREAHAQPRPAKAAPKLTKAPKLVKFLEAPYPEAERAAGKAATVVLQVAISATGTVDDAVVMESAGPAFDAAALAAVKQFVFEPAEIDDKPGPVKILYKYTFTLKPEAPTTAVFDGVVRTRKSKKPIAGATVELDSGQKATTDAAGRFHVDGVPPGTHAVSLAGEKLTALRTEETFEAGKKLDATYEIEEQEETPAGTKDADDLEIVVTAPPLRKQVVSTEVTADQARRVPGTQGDVLKVVENLPGVARSTVGSGALVVWGAAPENTRVYIEGVRVPRLYHDGGLRSVVHSDLVRAVDLAPGGWGAGYGRALGGLVTVDLRPLDEPGFHGSIAADAFDGSGSVRAALGDKVNVAVAVRKSWLDALLPLFTKRDISSLFPVPRYGDGAARLSYKISPRATVEVGGLVSADATDRATASADPAQRKSESRRLTWGRVYARYRHETESGVVTITPSFGADAQSLTSRFGGTPAELSSDSWIFGLRTTWRGRVAPWLVVTAGLDAEAVSAKLARTGSVTEPPREGDVRVFGQAPVDQINADAWHVVTLSAAPFVEGDIALAGDRLHIIPGLRIDPYAVSGSRRTPVEGATPSVGFLTGEPLIEPRLAVTFDASTRVRLKAAYGRYHEAPRAEDLSAVFGNPLLGPSRADHFLAGARFRVTETISVEATGFYTVSADLAARSTLPAPLLAEALEPTGAGRSYGVQLLVRKELTEKLFGWLSYTASRSERRDYDGGRWRLFDYDQTHVLTALASYQIGLGFEVGARFRVATGFPRTPVTSAYYDARTDTYQPIFGTQGSARIPPFIQLDLRASKRFTIGRTELEAYLDVQNVTNRQNAEEIVYTRDYTKQGNINGLPILPSLGVRFAW
ncbi:TonB family protein / TonB-dependent receptor [Minicystis rosea]|nr:TonB family protein / TonB-dependent receptor [Minicystis rosea]